MSPTEAFYGVYPWLSVPLCASCIAHLSSTCPEVAEMRGFSEPHWDLPVQCDSLLEWAKGMEWKGKRRVRRRRFTVVSVWNTVCSCITIYSLIIVLVVNLHLPALVIADIAHTCYLLVQSLRPPCIFTSFSPIGTLFSSQIFRRVSRGKLSNWPEVKHLERGLRFQTLVPECSLITHRTRLPPPYGARI